jgi:hypothetical protein
MIGRTWRPDAALYTDDIVRRYAQKEANSESLEYQRAPP